MFYMGAAPKMTADASYFNQTVELIIITKCLMYKIPILVYLAHIFVVLIFDYNQKF